MTLENAALPSWNCIGKALACPEEVHGLALVLRIESQVFGQKVLTEEENHGAMAQALLKS